MRYTVAVGTYFGIPVRVHATFPLILLLFGIEGWMTGGWRDAAWAVSLVLAVFVCVVLHEFGHSLQVKRYGIPVRDIVLLPIGGMARAERIPERPRQEIIVALSGPAVNFVLAGLLYGVIELRGGPTPDIESDFWVNLLAINLLLGVFNLVPAFPMDGGRVLRGILATRMSYLDATRRAKNVGHLIAVVFAVLGFATAKLLMLPVIAVFIFFGAIGEERMIRTRAALGGQSVKAFVVSAAAGSPSQGWVLPNRASGPALEMVIGEGHPVFPASMDAAHAYHLMRSKGLGQAVVAEDGHFCGFVFLTDLDRALKDTR